MNYNDGQVHLDFFNQKEDLDKIAEDFSEGDSLLKKCLLELWSKNIQTTACCRGHEEKESSIAYISFIVDENSKQMIQATCEYLYMQDGNIELDFSHSNNKNIFSIYMITEKDKNDYLKFLHNFLNQKKENEKVSNNILTYASYLLSLCNSSGLNCRYCIEKDKMMIGYYSPGTLLIFSNDQPQLSDLIDSIIETGNLPLTALSCDEKSLEKFINFICPGTFENKNGIQK